MKLPPSYTFTQKIVFFLQKIEAAKELIDYCSSFYPKQKNLYFRPAFFSLSLEGEKLSFLKEVISTFRQAKNSSVWHLANLYSWVEKNFRFGKDLRLSDLLYLHKLVMMGKTEKSAGKFRRFQEMSLLGEREDVYSFVPPELIEDYVRKLLNFINGEDEKFPPLKASLTLYTFLKISPFAEGNGLLSRLLFWLVLVRENYFCEGITVEEGLYQKKEEFFHYLSQEEEGEEKFLAFILELMYQSLERKKKELLTKTKREEENLLPRRKAIIQLAKEAKLISFSQLKGKFPEISGRMLRYDLFHLVKKGFLRKEGNTRGVFYSLKKEGK